MRHTLREADALQSRVPLFQLEAGHEVGELDPADLVAGGEPHDLREAEGDDGQVVAPQPRRDHRLANEPGLCSSGRNEDLLDGHFATEIEIARPHHATDTTSGMLHDKCVASVVAFLQLGRVRGCLDRGRSRAQ